MARKILFLIFFAACSANGFKLKQVLVFSRHNIRAPLNQNIDKWTPKELPAWEVDVAHLTPKGETLEEYMGAYFAEWFKKEAFLTQECPNKDAVYVYANHLNRTEQTARSFVKTAFNGCKITVNYRDDVISDPIFYPLIHNTTEEFKTIAKEQLKKKLDEINLNDAYSELNRIFELNNSEICRTKSVCDLTEAKDAILFEIEKEPDVFGPLSIGNGMADLFLMSYYNGVPLDKIAWGEIITQDQWKLFTEITRTLLYVRFSDPVIAKDVAKPLLKYILEIFLNQEPKFTFLVGHDSSLIALITALDFKLYELPEQDEKTPIGGKLVFQKWYDEELDRDLLKINYVYQSTEQLRNGTILSMENPPKTVIMEISNCSVDSNGYCLWTDFIEAIKNAIL